LDQKPVEHRYADSVGMISPKFQGHPLNGVEHEQRQPKGQVVEPAKRVGTCLLPGK
jgi:hypothetical protein